MEINPNRNVGPVIPAAGPAKAKSAAGTQESSDASFDGMDSLKSSLTATPDSRADVVAKAEDLVSQSNYPPPVMIQRIANLLAANLLTQEN